MLILRDVAQYIQPSRLTKIGAAQLIEGMAQRKTHDTDAMYIPPKMGVDTAAPAQSSMDTSALERFDFEVERFDFEVDFEKDEVDDSELFRFLFGKCGDLMLSEDTERKQQFVAELIVSTTGGCSICTCSASS